MENISFNVFVILNVMTLRNGKAPDKTYLEFLSKHFAENEKEKLFPNDSSFLNNLKNATLKI